MVSFLELQEKIEYTAAWMESGVILRLNYSFFGKPLPEHIKKDIPFYE